MAFTKTKEYWAYKIKNIKEALVGTQKALEKHKKNNSEMRVIWAHEDQIRHYEKRIIEEKNNYKIWQAGQ